MLHARSLAGFLDPKRVTVATVTPGMVNTSLFRGYPAWYRALTWPVRALYLRPAAEAAEGVVWAMTATDIEGESGKYYADGRAVEPSVAAQDDELAEALCMATSQLLSGGRR
jgi:NAD(P)-dependent dehydrogenase (short-subunit alcohol dehydrogenase family)